MPEGLFQQVGSDQCFQWTPNKMVNVLGIQPKSTGKEKPNMSENHAGLKMPPPKRISFGHGFVTIEDEQLHSPENFGNMRTKPTQTHYIYMYIYLFSS